MPMHVLLLTLFCHSFTASAQMESEIQQDVQAILAQRHPQASGADPWASLPPQASAIIQKMIQGGSSEGIERTRLLEGLGYFKDDATGEFLKSEVERTGGSLERATALESLGRSQGALAADFIQKYLGHSDKSTRQAAILALSRMDSTEAKRMAEGALSREKDAGLERRVRNETLDRKQPGRQGSALAPVASSTEAGLSRHFSGKFDGVAHVLEGPSERMAQLKATLTLSTDAAKPSELFLAGKRYALKRIQGQGGLASGAFLDGFGAAARELPFSAELSRLGHSHILRVEIRALKAILILKR